MERRVRIQWTETARRGLRDMPREFAVGLLKKARELEQASDPRDAGKPLQGPLAGHYRIRHSRYRAIYRVDEDVLAGGDVQVNITITFVAAGIRKERDKNDVYKLAQKLVEIAIDKKGIIKDEDDLVR